MHQDEEELGEKKNYQQKGIERKKTHQREEELGEKGWRRRITGHKDCKIARNSRCFRADQAAMAAFFSACFLVLAASPENVMPATSTEHVKTGRCPGPERVVVYTGNETPAL